LCSAAAPKAGSRTIARRIHPFPSRSKASSSFLVSRVFPNVQNSILSLVLGLRFDLKSGAIHSLTATQRLLIAVLRFCRAELLQDNYFHAVFEATKSVAQKIRDKTGLTGDGADIVDKAFGLRAPMLAINSLRTDTEQSEQTGFANLLKGMFGTFRNPTGHAAKITWKIDEQDALDLLSLVSYMHRRLDAAAIVPRTSATSPTP
jgi:uncharacterized protein (TIGR02391 family)